MQNGERKRKELKDMLKEIQGSQKPLPKCCGRRMKVVPMDFAEETVSGKEVLAHNAPAFMCEACGNREIQLEVTVLVEEVCEATNLTEIDFNEIEKLIDTVA